MRIINFGSYKDVAGDTRYIPLRYDGIPGRRRFDYHVGAGIATLGGLGMLGYTMYKNRKKKRDVRNESIRNKQMGTK